MTTQAALVVLIALVFMLIVCGFMSWWLGYKLLKIGKAILKTGFIPAGSSLNGLPFKDTPVNRGEGYCLIIFSILGFLLGLIFMFGWVFMLKN